MKWVFFCENLVLNFVMNVFIFLMYFLNIFLCNCKLLVIIVLFLCIFFNSFVFWFLILDWILRKCFFIFFFRKLLFFLILDFFFLIFFSLFLYCESWEEIKEYLVLSFGFFCLIRFEIFIILCLWCFGRRYFL